MSTFDVRVHSVLVNKLAKGASYTVRWVVAGKPFRDKVLTRSRKSAQVRRALQVEG